MNILNYFKPLNLVNSCSNDSIPLIPAERTAPGSDRIKHQIKQGRSGNSRLKEGDRLYLNITPTCSDLQRTSFSPVDLGSPDLPVFMSFLFHLLYLPAFLCDFIPGPLL